MLHGILTHLCRPIQRHERIVELTGLKMGFRDPTKPLGIGEVDTVAVPVGQTGAELGDPLRLESETD